MTKKHVPPRWSMEVKYVVVSVNKECQDYPTNISMLHVPDLFLKLSFYYCFDFDKSNKLWDSTHIFPVFLYHRITFIVYGWPRSFI